MEEGKWGLPVQAAAKRWEGSHGYVPNKVAEGRVWWEEGANGLMCMGGGRSAAALRQEQSASEGAMMRAPGKHLVWARTSPADVDRLGPQETGWHSDWTGFISKARQPCSVQIQQSPYGQSLLQEHGKPHYFKLTILPNIPVGQFHF